MARRPIGERPLTNAERQARHRDRRRGENLKLWRPAPPLQGPRAAEWFTAPPPSRAGQYRVIYADPPWNFRTRTAEGAGRSGDYPKLPIRMIESLPVAKWADPKLCLLFLWTTSPHLLNSGRVFRPWRFRYSTVGFVWVKLHPGSNPELVRPGDLDRGNGYYTRSCAELLLIGKRGSGVPDARLNAETPQVVHWPTTGEHSEKPAIFRELIEGLFPGPYLELFARHSPRPGWDAWGDQVGLLDSGGRPARRWKSDGWPGEAA